MFQNITHIVTIRLFFQLFQTGKDSIILQLKNYRRY